MRKLIVNMFVTTGLALVIVAIVVLINGTQILPFAGTVLPVFYANILIHLGLLLTWKFESRYLFFESLLDVVYIATVIIVFGWIYGWFVLTPIWLLILMVVFMYIVGLFLRMGGVRRELNEINRLLDERSKRRPEA